jgi:ABC-2 type transport system ATP-binding protein
VDNILKIENINKKFKSFKLNNVSFELKKGSIMGLIGQNGAGKTTLIKLILNAINKDSGNITIFDKDYSKYEKQIKEKIGFVFSENYFYEDISVKEFKFIYSRFYKKWNEKKCLDYLNKFKIPLKSKIKELSTGMKTKLSLALAISHEAELILLDEPTSGIDPIFRREILDIFLEIMQDEKKSILFSTHITTDLEKIADYITLIDNGEIIFSESKDFIKENYFLIKGDDDLLDNETKKRVIGLEKNSFGFEGLIYGIENIKNQKDKFIFEKATLEDIMVYIAKGGLKNAI